jgi:hypothetical protein
LHTLMPGWADATVSFMLSGGYNVAASISQVQQETLVIWGEQDKIVSRTFAEVRLRETQVARKLSYDFLNSFLVAYVHIAFGLLT